MNKSNRKLIIDKISHIIFLVIGVICSLSIVIIISFIFLKGSRPFIIKYANGQKATLIKFLFSTKYNYNNYGALGIVINTIFIVFVVSIIALPLSVLTSLFIVRIAPKKIGHILQMVVELLSSIPSIIFGLFGMGIINPMVKNLAKIFNYQTAGGVSTLSVILVLVMMIMPTITTLSITSMKAIKDTQINASLALGATMMQTNYNIVIKGAKSGIFSALILGIGRALGEATAVSMVCGGNNGISIGLFNPTSTITSTMLEGIHESVGLDYDIRFSLGILLILLILFSNIILNIIKKRMCRYE